MTASSATKTTVNGIDDIEAETGVLEEAARQGTL